MTTHVARQKYCPIYVSRSTENKVITMSAIFPSNLNDFLSTPDMNDFYDASIESKDGQKHSVAKVNLKRLTSNFQLFLGKFLVTSCPGWSLGTFFSIGETFMKFFRLPSFLMFPMSAVFVKSG